MGLDSWSQAGIPQKVPGSIKINPLGDEGDMFRSLSKRIVELEDQLNRVTAFLNGISFAEDSGLRATLGPNGGEIIFDAEAASAGISASGTQDLYKIVQLREEKKNADGTWSLVSPGNEVGGYDDENPTRRLTPYWDYIRARRVASP